MNDMNIYTSFIGFLKTLFWNDFRLKSGKDGTECFYAQLPLISIFYIITMAHLSTLCEWHRYNTINAVTDNSYFPSFLSNVFSCPRIWPRTPCCIYSLPLLILYSATNSQVFPSFPQPWHIWRVSVRYFVYRPSICLFGVLSSFGWVQMWGNNTIEVQCPLHGTTSVWLIRGDGNFDHYLKAMSAWFLHSQVTLPLLQSWERSHWVRPTSREGN